MEMYNSEVKERFLNNYPNEGTQTTVKAIFLKTALTEETFGKDLYNFSKEDIADTFPELKPKFASTASAYGRFIKLYLSWAIKNGYRDNNENPLNGLPVTWFTKFVSESRKIHFSFEEFYEIVENLDNSQDQALLSLIWEGNVVGEKFSELRQIQYNHIHWNENKIDIMDEKGKYSHTVTLSDRVMRYVEQAYKQSTYITYKEDGEYTEKEILQSDYLLRNVKSPRATSGEPINFAVLYTRLKQIREVCDLEYLTPNSIKQSSILFDAYQLYLRDGEFGMKQRNEIGDKFRLPTIINTNGKEYYNPALMTFINPENIKSLYNIDMTM